MDYAGPGDEAGRIQRNRVLGGQPRPLTDRERTRLRETMAPVLRDVQASGAVSPVIWEETQDGVHDEWVSVMLWSADGTGMGVFIPTEPTAADQVARLAEQVQEWEIEELAAAGRPPGRSARITRTHIHWNQPRLSRTRLSGDAPGPGT